MASPFPPAWFRDDKGEKDCSACFAALDALPALRDLGAQLDSLPEPTLRVLEWLIAPLPPRRRSVFRAVPALPAFQNLLGSPPTATLQYLDGVSSAAVRSFVSPRVAYHGTPFDRLHSILNTGLISMSGTKLQRNGANFGSGIYLATHPHLSYNFSQPAYGWKHSALGYRLRCMLVCEVDMELAREEADQESSRSSGKPETHLVVQRADAVRITHVVVYMDERYRAEPAAGPGAGVRGVLSAVARRMNLCSALLVLYLAFIVCQGLVEHRVWRRWWGWW